MVSAPYWNAGTWSRNIAEANVHHYECDRLSYLENNYYKVIDLTDEQIQADNIKMLAEIEELRKESAELFKQKPVDWLSRARREHRLQVIDNLINGLKKDLKNDL